MECSVTAAAPGTVAADLLVVGVATDKVAESLAPLGEPFAGDLARAAKADEFDGKAGRSVAYPSFGRCAADRVLLVGMGDGSDDGIRQAAGVAGLASRARGAGRVALVLGALDARRTADAALAFGVGNYRFDRYKPETERKAPATSLTFAGKADLADLPRARAVGAGLVLARDLVNEPAAVVYPESLAAAAQALAGDRLQVEVWDETRIREAGMGGITAVGQGSARPPRFAHLRYVPDGTPRRKLALVGKGVTFDSGGLSLKPSPGMQTMRCDMAGSAAVLGAMRAVRELCPDVEVHGVVGLVENMASGSSYKLGDVLRMYNGKTVEIHNTDAEGRLVLADCLSYASRLGVEAVVDVATLTGACVVALGDQYSGLFTADDSLAADLLAAASAAGENLWRMPMPAAYKDQLKAEWGAIKNVGAREGGAITAALFLSEFVDGPRWAHVDIAGPAFYEKQVRHFASGGTGAMVAALTEWVTRR